MRLTDVIAGIEQTAPLYAAAAWDVSGVQVAARRQDVSRLAVCLDPTPAAVRAAVEQGADMVLSHHPLLLKARLPAQLDAYHETLSLLFRQDVALYAAHTSLDANTAGPAGWLAAELGISAPSLLETTAEADGRRYGFGCCGNVAPCSLDDVVNTLRQHISLDDAVFCGPVPERIRRVAYCTGSGASLLAAASHCGADVYITGDVKYHAALDADICVLDVGHHSLEEEMMRRFAVSLSSQLTGIEVFFLPSASPFHRVR